MDRSTATPATGSSVVLTGLDQIVASLIEQVVTFPRDAAQKPVCIPETLTRVYG